MIEYGIYLDEKEQILELNTFMNEMLAILEGKNRSGFDFDYKTESIKKFCDEIAKKRVDYLNKRVFARKFDNEKLVKMLEDCTSAQIGALRGCFKLVYAFSNIKEYFSEDKGSLEDLKQRIKDLLEKSKLLDKIQRLQLKYFVQNLDGYINIL